MTTTTSISIIIPIWNSVSYLTCCLDSILKQSFRHIEVILIDDASTDGTNEILQRYLCADTRVILHTNPRNVGIGACRNIGLELARGEYILFVDSDDSLAEGTLEALAQYSSANSHDILLFNGSAFRQEDMAIVKTEYIQAQAEWFKENGIEGKNLLPLFESHSSCLKLYTSAFLNRNHIRFPEGIYGEDVEFWMRCLVTTRNVGYLPYFGYMRRYRTNSVTTSGNDKNIVDRFNNIAALLELTQNDKDLYQYDGIREASARRVYRANGEEAFDEILKGLRCMKSHVGYASILTVINVDEQPDKLYRYYKSIGINSPDLLYPDSTHDKKDKAVGMVGDWLIKIFDIWHNDKEDNRPYIRLFDVLVNLLLGNTGNGNEPLGRRYNGVITVKSNGNMEPVDSLKICRDGMTKTTYNISTNHLHEIEGNRLFQLYYKAHQDSVLCTQCRSCMFKTHYTMIHRNLENVA